MHGSEDALALHAEHPAIDLHADSLLWGHLLGYDLHQRHNAPLPWAAFAGHVDLPRMQEGGVGAQFFGLVGLPIVGPAGMAATIDKQIDVFEAALATNRGRLVRALTADDVRVAAQKGQIAGLLGIEGAHALEGKVDKLDHFARRGVRYLGLCHFSPNEACFPAYTVGRTFEQGLTRFGRDVVERCASLGVVVDLAHINRAGFFEACALSKHPPIVSHTGVLGAFDHWRNIGDDQLRAIADRGGCVGVIFCPRYLGGAGIDAVVKHLRHILDVCGEDAPALGSDWDGFIIPTWDLRDASRLPLLTDAMLAAGFSARTIIKILRDNALRVLEDNPRPMSATKAA